MALIRFRPLSQDLPRDLTDIQSHMNRLFDNFIGQPSSPGVVERVWAPAADMYETGNEVVVAAELPGLNEKDIHLSITGDLLTIRGERRWTGGAEDATHYRQERWFGKFERGFSLPVPVETGQVKATYRDGVLTVKLPKSEAIKPKEIKIDAV
ncbi:MAG TPA: Hsp20/alpha crystallin family protein [Candidatus Nitrosotalea sp.]|nr:Hsp20/alpha crystallin family protein [Candidatus Nitrosotalea sp.]